MSRSTKPVYVVRKPISRGGRIVYPGETFSAGASGAHVRRWLQEGRIKISEASKRKAVAA